MLADGVKGAQLPPSHAPIEALSRRVRLSCTRFGHFESLDASAESREKLSTHTMSN